MAVRSYDSPDLRRQLAEWNRRLYEDGFDDVETAGPDGPLQDQVSNAGTRCSTTTALEGYAAGGTTLLAVVLAAQHEALEALYTPALWRGLPARARRWWALQVFAGLSEARAMALLCRRQGRLPSGHELRMARRWRATILARIEAVRRAGGDDE